LWQSQSKKNSTKGQKKDDYDTDSMDDNTIKEAFDRYKSSSERRTAKTTSSEDENDCPLQKRVSLFVLNGLEYSYVFLKIKQRPIANEEEIEESSPKKTALGATEKNSAYECDTEEDEDLKIPSIPSEGQNERSSPTPPTTPSKSTSSLRGSSFDYRTIR